MINSLPLIFGARSAPLVLVSKTTSFMWLKLQEYLSNLMKEVNEKSQNFRKPIRESFWDAKLQILFMNQNFSGELN